MSFWLINCIAVFVISEVCAGIVIPQILLIALRKKLMDAPDRRKIHHSFVPRLGGLAFKPVIFFSIALTLGINTLIGNDNVISEISGDISSILFAFCAIMILYLVGIADDLIGVKYRAKFAAQIICGLLLIAGGVYIDNLHGMFMITELPLWISYPLTLLVIVFITNAINLIDGIDGLASGLCAIATLMYGILFYMAGYFFYSMVSVATLGVLVPFFYYNVFGHEERNKKIFMGDTGSLTIGMILSFLSIKLNMCLPSKFCADFNPFVLAFAPLLIPCLDVIRVYFQRLRNHKNPFLPDNNHIHHKLLALGLKKSHVMISIITFSLILSLINVFASKFININILLAADISIWIIANCLISNKINKISA